MHFCRPPVLPAPPPPPRCPQQKSIGTFYFIPVQFELLYRHFNRASPISRSEFASAEPRGALLDGWAKLLTETALRRAVLKGDWRQYSDPPFVPLFLTGRYMHLLAEKLSSSVFFILLVSQPVYAAPSDSFFFAGGGWGGGYFTDTVVIISVSRRRPADGIKTAIARRHMVRARGCPADAEALRISPITRPSCYTFQM